MKPMKSAKAGVKPRATMRSSPAKARCATARDILGAPPAGDAGRKPAPAVPARWRWHFDTLLALRQQLSGNHHDLRATGAEPLEAHSLSPADSATDEFDHALILREFSAEQDALLELDAALQRILAGTYGICEESGASIPALRLRSVPWTRFTRAVEERLEREGAIRGAHVENARSLRGDGRPWRIRPRRPARRRSH